MMEAIQLRLDPIIADDNRVLWMGFTKETEDSYCEVRFLKRFGRFPDRIITSHNIKLVGPIPADRTPIGG